MNKQKSPYDKNAYLKNDEEVLKEVLFFEKFGLDVKETSEDTFEQDDEDKEK